MDHSAQTTVTILIASDSTADAALVKKLLDSEFDQVFVSTDPERAVEDFERRRPDVLVLAFDSLEKSERYYLGLYRLSAKGHLSAHRTVILCGKDEVKQVYQLCRKEHFDDYVLFWPMTNDAPRLPMAVHHALRDLLATRDHGPSVAEFAAQARRLAELEALLNRQMAQGCQHIEGAGHAMAHAEREIGAALDGFSRRLVQGELPEVLEIKSVAGLEREIDRFKREDIGRHLRSAAESVQPLHLWTDEFMQECAPLLETARALDALADRVQITVLVVDDDDFQRKIVAKILEAQNYRPVFAGSGVEALTILRKLRPDLILMDVVMPDMDGMETTRRLKAMPELAEVPVVMVTGKSEGNVVIDSLKAGAVDFVVKPFDRDTLMAKIERALRTV